MHLHSMRFSEILYTHFYIDRFDKLQFLRLFIGEGEGGVRGVVLVSLGEHLCVLREEGSTSCRPLVGQSAGWLVGWLAHIGREIWEQHR